jgi:hypothetical protein
MAEGNGTSPGRWKYGIFALAIGAITVLLAVLIVNGAWSDAPSRAGVLAAVVGAISGLVGAYFGIQVGGAEADATRKHAASEKQRADDAESDKARALRTVAMLAERMPPSPDGKDALERLKLSADP